QHTFRWKDKRLCQRELFLLVRHDRFTPVISDPVEAETLLEFRWWPLGELDSARHPITPVSLRAIVESYLERGAPQGNLPLEIVPDSN
ncbi:MAG: NUDIX domain-containing protein, partial [Bdellovibrionota bacterium]